MTKASQPETLTRTTLRIPTSLYRELEEAAKYHGRSINAETIARLQAASVNDQFSRLFAELAEIKAIDKEILSTVADRRP
ncbi:Arc family DNA-binding protein [Massilia violaceinigra]|uniref:Arc family DNA-binding protein n=1 Tax=Massilia violaceinigra TaxID=2045208 RepID=A0ABY4A7L8_9BURK|nr:Arc family DNA-binding protein [Massilia violaceinigra]UOD30721.1 Arc family DNA-binding protein [Massilia violaceinigra]